MDGTSKGATHGSSVGYCVGSSVGFQLSLPHPSLPHPSLHSSPFHAFVGTKVLEIDKSSDKIHNVMSVHAETYLIRTILDDVRNSRLQRRRNGCEK